MRERVSSASDPLLSLVLITYNQQETIGAALHAALAQTYHPLEVIVSDDCSKDGTADRIQDVLASYAGPHQVVFLRNASNLGIGANISQAVSRSSGEMIVIAAGDDISMPHRCERIAREWVAYGKRHDLVSSHLLDLDAQGQTHGVITPSDLSRYRCAEDWLADRPHVVGAAQAWTRRLFDHFGPLPTGVVAEDLVMAFRAICAGGCLTLSEPLVQYRRGGLSGRVRNLSAQDTVRRLLASNRHALIETVLLQRDAQIAGCEAAMEGWLQREMALQTFIRDVFAASGTWRKVAISATASQVSLSRRIRMLTYAAWPWLLSPLFWLKQMVRKLTRT